MELTEKEVVDLKSFKKQFKWSKVRYTITDYAIKNLVLS